MDRHEFSKKTIEILNKIRDQKPLIHHITNFVVMNSTANVTLAIGASPIMAHAHEEVDVISTFSRALNLNIGTISPYWLDSMLIAGKVAGERGIPIILDPVGSGATPLRTEAAKRILSELPVTVIRGNASEILSLFTNENKIRIRGVDSLEKADTVRDGATRLAKELKKIIAITGEVDFITDGERDIEVHNGNPMLAVVTGTGCSATTAISCFCSVEKDPLVASACALGYYGLAGEEAALSACGPGSFQTALYDTLYNMAEETIMEKLKIKPVK
ncbi:MAG TPA: hydroxyethylthiazole kinase [Syntrophorhabdaceae bacterium]|jgi:hydroxyethylthiazole kinase|nr:hydroxyethylthiazole kinase [Syntrophorhabdaceae bacterium]HOB68885.1 hydroxyethylthiazole kinase [Syntrophorhabdaceae bacterium]HPN98193.1 hydroxyethylthiazole kinase [Syntrophorhabdaceae bacterium]